MADSSGCRFCAGRPYCSIQGYCADLEAFGALSQKHGKSESQNSDLGFQASPVPTGEEKNGGVGGRERPKLPSGVFSSPPATRIFKLLPAFLGAAFLFVVAVGVLYAYMYEASYTGSVSPSACCLAWEGDRCIRLTNDDGVDGCWPQADIGVSIPYSYSILTATFDYVALGGTCQFHTQVCGGQDTGSVSGPITMTFDCGGVQGPGLITPYIRAQGGGECEVDNLRLYYETAQYVPTNTYPYGSCSLVPDADFDSGSGWTTAGGATIGGGVASIPAAGSVYRFVTGFDTSREYTITAVASGTGQTSFCLGSACATLEPIEGWYTYTGYTVGEPGPLVQVLVNSGTLDLHYICFTSGGSRYGCLNDQQGFSDWVTEGSATISGGVLNLPSWGFGRQYLTLPRGDYEVGVVFTSPTWGFNLLDICTTGGDGLEDCPLTSYTVLTGSNSANIPFSVLDAYEDVSLKVGNTCCISPFQVSRVCVSVASGGVSECFFKNPDMDGDVFWDAANTAVWSDGKVILDDDEYIAQAITVPALAVGSYSLWVTARVSGTHPISLVMDGGDNWPYGIFTFTSTEFSTIQAPVEPVLPYSGLIAFAAWADDVSDSLVIDRVCLGKEEYDARTCYFKNYDFIENDGVNSPGWYMWGPVTPLLERSLLEFGGGISQTIYDVDPGVYQLIVRGNGLSDTVSRLQIVYYWSEVGISSTVVSTVPVVEYLDVRPGMMLEDYYVGIRLDGLQAGSLGVSFLNMSTGTVAIDQICLRDYRTVYGVVALGSIPECGEVGSPVPPKFNEEFPGTDVGQWVPWLGKWLWDVVGYPLACLLVHLFNILIKAIQDAFNGFFSWFYTNVLTPVVTPISDIVALWLYVLNRFLLFWRQFGVILVWWINFFTTVFPLNWQVASETGLFGSVGSAITSIGVFCNLPLIAWVLRILTLIMFFFWINWVRRAVLSLGGSAPVRNSKALPSGEILQSGSD